MQLTHTLPSQEAELQENNPLADMGPDLEAMRAARERRYCPPAEFRLLDLLSLSGKLALPTKCVIMRPSAGARP